MCMSLVKYCIKGTTYFLLPGVVYPDEAITECCVQSCFQFSETRVVAAVYEVIKAPTS